MNFVLPKASVLTHIFYSLTAMFKDCIYEYKSWYIYVVAIEEQQEERPWIDYSFLAGHGRNQETSWTTH